MDDVLLCVNDSCGLNNCYPIKCNKQQEKYCFSRANIFTSGVLIQNNKGKGNVSSEQVFIGEKIF